MNPRTDNGCQIPNLTSNGLVGNLTKFRNLLREFINHKNLAAVYSFYL